MKSPLFWPYAASLAVHAIVVMAVSWLHVNAATTPAAHAYVEVTFLDTSAEGEGERTREAPAAKTAPAPERPPNGEGEAPAEPPNSAEQVHVPPQHAKREGERTREAPAPERAPEREGEAPAEPRLAFKEPSELAKQGPPNSAEKKHAPPQHAKREGERTREAHAAKTAPAPAPSAARAVTAPSVLRIIEPNYPRSARRQGHEGRVIVEAVIGSDGGVGNATIVESSGYGELDDAALNAAIRSRFAPATLAGTPVASTKQLVFRFVLEEER